MAGRKEHLQKYVHGLDQRGDDWGKHDGGENHQQIWCGWCLDKRKTMQLPWLWCKKFSSDLDKILICWFYNIPFLSVARRKSKTFKVSLEFELIGLKRDWVTFEIKEYWHRIDCFWEFKMIGLNHNRVKCKFKQYWNIKECFWEFKLLG